MYIDEFNQDVSKEYNIPREMQDKLLLCKQEDIKLISDIIELLIQRNK